MAKEPKARTRGRVFQVLDDAFARYWQAERHRGVRLESLANYAGVEIGTLYNSSRNGCLTARSLAKLRAAERQLDFENGGTGENAVLTLETVGRLAIPEGA